MTWEAKLIEALQNVAGGALDYLIFILTYLGDKLFFVLVAAVIYWCVSKKYGFRFVNVFLFSAGCNDIVKSLFRRVRPYEAYEGIKSIFVKTDGWSFPSGHSNSIASMTTQIVQKAHKEKKYFRCSLILAIVLTLIVMFSRVYLGQHYPTDVVVGALSGSLLVIVFGRVFTLLENKIYRFWVVALPLSVIGTIALIVSGSSESNSLLIHALAAYAAASLGYFLEKKYVDYEVRSGKFAKQVLKVLLGISSSILFLFGGEYLLGLFIPASSVFEAVIIWYLLYFAVVIWGMVGVMFVFKKLKI